MTDFFQINQGDEQSAISVISSGQITGQTFVAGTSSLNILGNGCMDDAVYVSTWTGTAELKTIDLCCSSFGASSTLVIRVFDGFADDNDDIDPPGTTKTILGTSGTQVVTSPNPTYVKTRFSFTGVNLTAGNDYYFMVYLDSGSGASVTTSGGTNPYPDGARVTSNGLVVQNTNASNELTFRLGMFQTNFTGTLGDPMMFCLNDTTYHLPVDNHIYCLFDSGDPEDRLVINGKCHIRKNGQSYLRYVYLYYNDEELLVRLPNLVLKNITSDVNSQVKNDNAPDKDVQRYMGTSIREVQSDSKIKKYHLKTKKFGEFTVGFRKTKFGFGLKGVVSALNTDKAFGSLCGEDNMMKIGSIVYKTNI